MALDISAKSGAISSSVANIVALEADYLIAFIPLVGA